MLKIIRKFLDCHIEWFARQKDRDDMYDMVQRACLESTLLNIAAHKTSKAKVFADGFYNGVTAMNTQMPDEVMQNIRCHANHCFNDGDYLTLREAEETEGREKEKA